MKRGKNLCLVFIISLSTLSLVAQRPADNTLTFEKKVKDVIIVPFNGITLISEGNRIHGYSPEEEKILWIIDGSDEVKLKVTDGGIGSNNAFTLARSEGNISVIPDTPFFQVFFGQKLFVYNSYNAEVLFASGSDDRYFQVDYIFDENALLLKGVGGESLVISKYALSHKAFVWETPVSETFLKLFGLKLLSGSSRNETDKLTFSEDKIFVLTRKQLFVLNRNNGALLWKVQDDDIINFKTSLAGDKLLLIKDAGGAFSIKNELELYDTETGTPIWDKSIVTRMLILFEDWEDRMLLAHYKGFNFYNYQTGEKLWKKDPKGKGIKAVIPIESDFLYVYDDEMMLINKNGMKLWKGDVTISDNKDDAIHFLEKTKNGRVLYITSTYANLVDYKSGKRIWGGNLKLNEKRPTIAQYDEDSGNFIVFNDEELYKFNENDDKRPKPFCKLKLKSEKTISDMALISDIISISGQSEVVGVDKSGQVVFHNKYKQPGEFGRQFAKGMLIAGRVAALAATTEVTTTTSYRDRNGNLKESSNTTAVFGKRARAIGEAGYIGGTIAQSYVQNRFNALQETDTYALIFARGENDEKLLVKVDKRTGEELDKIILENNKPIYDLDRASDDIYYSRKNEVKIFKSQSK